MSTTTKTNKCEYDEPVEYTIEVKNVITNNKKIVFAL